MSDGALHCGGGRGVKPFFNVIGNYSIMFL